MSNPTDAGGASGLGYYGADFRGEQEEEKEEAKDENLMKIVATVDYLEMYLAEERVDKLPQFFETLKVGALRSINTRDSVTCNCGE